MSDTYIAKRPPNVRVAQAHLNALSAGPWDFHVDMAGVGGVRQLSPTCCYLGGQLGAPASQITSALARTREQVASVGGHSLRGEKH